MNGAGAFAGTAFTGAEPIYGGLEVPRAGSDGDSSGADAAAADAGDVRGGTTFAATATTGADNEAGGGGPGLEAEVGDT